jgi:hypothetical protein
MDVKKGAIALFEEFSGQCRSDHTSWPPLRKQCPKRVTTTVIGLKETRYYWSDDNHCDGPGGDCELLE